MCKSLFFHDGNIISIACSGEKRSFKFKLTLDLYDDLESTNRKRKVLKFRKLRYLAFTGDFAQIALNYSAGSIEDGAFEEVEGYQKLSIWLTGGSLIVEGLLTVEAAKQM